LFARAPLASCQTRTHLPRELRMQQRITGRRARVSSDCRSTPVLTSGQQIRPTDVSGS